MRAHRTILSALVALLLAASPGCRRTPPAPDEDSSKPPPAPALLSTAVEVEAEYGTARLSNDPDDPAIWVHPQDPARSLVLATMKVAAPAGAVIVFGMDGQIRQIVSGIDRPNNVDIEYGVRLAGRQVDIAVVTERLARRLRVFRIDPAAGQIVEAGAFPVLEGQQGEAAAPMGIAMYRRDRDGAVFAIVSPKEGLVALKLPKRRTSSASSRPPAPSRSWYCQRYPSLNPRRSPGACSCQLWAPFSRRTCSAARR